MVKKLETEHNDFMSVFFKRFLMLSPESVKRFKSLHTQSKALWGAIDSVLPKCVLCLEVTPW
jgi:hypothetical protein